LLRFRLANGRRNQKSAGQGYTALADGT
jgi:hypothetical protein